MAFTQKNLQILREENQVNEIEVNYQNDIKGGGGRAREDPRPIIPEGIYEAACTDYKIIPFKGIKKTYLKLLITAPAEFYETEIWSVFQHYDRYGARSKFYKLVQMVRKRRLKKGEPMHPKELLGHIFQIKAKTVTRDEDGNDRPEYSQYSKAEIVNHVQRMDNSRPKTINRIPDTNYRLPSLPSETEV